MAEGSWLMNAFNKGDDDGRSSAKVRESDGAGNLFKDINDLRNKPMDLLPPQSQEDADAQERAKYNDTIFGHIAGSKAFEITTLTLISLNAVAIGYDTDYSARYGKPDNLYDGPIGFILLEWTFAIYFSAEVLIRFIAYKSKVACLLDPWFIFDSSLVTMMVVETWVLPFLGSGGPFAQLSILRLLRLLRITRMARLMRAVPEMMVIIKGMVAATRTVVCTGALLLLVLYTFMILFTNEYHQGNTPDDDLESDSAKDYFGSMGKSMFTLFIMGTILDDVTNATNAIRNSKRTMMLVAFIIFILISSFMMLNMLIGVLVEVVGATADGERAKSVEANVREAIAQLFDSMDKDSNREISCSEFLSMREHKQVMDALADLDIQKAHFQLYAELFFRPAEEGGPTPSLSYEELCKLILRLRPGSFVSALDFASFSREINGIHDRIKDRIVKVENLALDIAGETIPMECERSDTSMGNARTGLTGASSIVDKLQTESRLVPPGATDKNAGPPQPAEQRLVNGASVSSSAPCDPHHLSEADRERLDCTGSADIIEELQRRFGLVDLEKLGVPFSMLDEELQTRVKAASDQGADAFVTLGVPQLEDATVYV
jgi:voltage-gated sodium channel